ncbi:MAG: S9 family peptidase [Planctomycetes bacterium]|nr:S9 family peptidase [Planctomycetota bacterium]
MLAMDRISDPQVSPDEQWVSFGVSVTDLEGNKRRSDLWLVRPDGTGLRQLTSHPAADVNARWLDARTLVFLSSRGGSLQVWKMRVDGGEPEQLTKFPISPENFDVFPGGKRLLLSFEVWPELKGLQASADKDAQEAKKKHSARIYETALFRHWDSWEDHKRSHVFTWELGSSEPIDLMQGMDCDAPTKPFGGFEETSISPDGAWVAFTTRDVGREEAWSTNTDVFLVPADGSSAPRNVTSDAPGYDLGPAFSPDGATLGYLSMARAGYEADRQQIVLMNVASGEKRKLASEWDRSASELTWSRDGKTIFTSAANLGHVSIFSIDVDSGAVKLLLEKGTNAGVKLLGARLLLSRDTLKSPVELVSINADGSDLRALTKLNESKLAVARMGDYEQFTFSGAHGDTVWGFAMKPADFQPGVKYPVAFLIHGGPQGSFGDHFHYRWNPQAYAGAGFGVVFIDFHGSTGYGQKFTDAIQRDWGGAPLEDLLKGLDAAVEKYPFLDGSRVAALGASYGGYMINWIAGNAPERFKCLVNHDGVFDTRMGYFDTEELWFPEWEHGGTPWEHREEFDKHNPALFVGQWKTPMLVVHGGQDFRVVETHGMGAFNALQRKGIPSKFVYFPDENHWVLKPQNSIFWHEQVLGWIRQWTGQ